MSASARKHASRLARTLAVVPLSLVALLGCATIIGLDDYTVAKPKSEGNAGQGGAAGKGGAASAGQSGRAGAAHGGDAGDLGQAGDGEPSSSGSANVAGDSGAGGESGAPPQLPPIVGCDGKTAFQPNEEIIASCIMRGGCSPFSPVRTISTCVTYNTQQALPGEHCTLHKKTCEEYQACEHVGIAPPEQCSGNQKTRCEGNQAINCDTDARETYDCDALGGTCATYAYSGGTYADCKLDVSPDTTCSTETDGSKYFCHSADGEDDLLYYCEGGEAYGSSCTSLAYCSGDATAGDANCYYNLAPCSTTKTTCTGDVSNVCSDGSLFQYDCGTMGLSCSISDNTDYCLAPGCVADDVDKCTESCSADGSQLTFCYGGAPYTVDCTNYGFTHCESATTSSGTAYSACRL